MLLEVKREPSTNVCTLGRLFVDGEFECFTLEDVVREVAGEPVEKWKILGQTAIPSGTYSLVVNFSERFEKMLPLLEGVPGFDGVRIHSGNVADNTEGCLLVGRQRGVNRVDDSRAAFAPLIAKIRAALAGGETVQIKLTNATSGQQASVA